MEASDFYHEEVSSVSIQTKYMANDFYRSLTNAMREYVVESVKNDGSRADQLAYNVWTMMSCFWYSFKYSGRINNDDRIEMDGHYLEDTIKREKLFEGEDKKGRPYCHGVLSQPFKNYSEAMFAMDKLFEKAGKAGIFIDYSLQLGDYDPEKVER